MTTCADHWPAWSAAVMPTRRALYDRLADVGLVYVCAACSTGTGGVVFHSAAGVTAEQIQERLSRRRGEGARST